MASWDRQDGSSPFGGPPQGGPATSGGDWWSQQPPPPQSAPQGQPGVPATVPSGAPGDAASITGDPMDPKFIEAKVKANMIAHGITPSDADGSGAGDYKYYVKQILGTGVGWNKDSDTYWGGPQGRIALKGGFPGGGGGGGGQGQYGTGSFASAPNVDMSQDPGYLERMKMGTDALQGAAAAKGSLLSGGTLKALARYGQNYGSNEYGAMYDRARGAQQDVWSRLQGVQQAGQGAQQQTYQRP